VDLDHLSPTPVDPRVVNQILRVMTKDFANASSGHSLGRKAAEEISQAKKHVADLVGCFPRELVFTSGATEAINLILKGFVNATLELRSKRNARATENAGNPQTQNGDLGKTIGLSGNKPLRILSLPVEHKAVLDVLEHLQQMGKITVEYLPVDDTGRMDLSALESNFKKSHPPELLVSMAANNEIGNVYPLEKIGELCRQYNVPWFCDLSQYAGKLAMDFHSLGISAACLSAHKFYGPQGVGVAILRDDFPVQPMLHGGGQQKAKRPGTLNLPGIVGLGEAARLAKLEMEEREVHTRKLRELFIAELEKALAQKSIRLQINGDQANNLPGVAHLSLPGLWNAQILQAVDHELAISTGSACQSGIEQPSHVLRAMGLSEENMRGALRISFGKDNTIQETRFAVSTLMKALL
ncbi:MAG: cysteine desulfurase, partial [Leptospiraceae bacterium]|nr:cysteine desulfurase [Leptospiraceae bacterium]